MYQLTALWNTRTITNMDTRILTNRHHRAALEGTYSEVHFVISGVPQGKILAPLLFLCYINDLPVSISNNIRLYADDVMLFFTIHSISDSNNLQQVLIHCPTGPLHGICHSTQTNVNKI